MSANSQADLQQVKLRFENFRIGRSEGSKGRLPESLWAEAVELLEHYPFNVVCRELKLDAEYLSRRAGLANKNEVSPGKNKSSKFLSLTTRELNKIKNGANNTVAVQSADSECRLVIERVDGSRMTLNLPIEWSRIEALCRDFLRR